jgi:carbon monoxide dehydrogenase subunit G
MRRVEAEELVGASRDEVWELLDDLEGMPSWLPRVRAITASGPAHAGTLYRERTSTFGVPGLRDWEIVEHRRPTRQVRVAFDGGLERAIVFTLEARGTGTRLHVEVELRSSLPVPLGLVHEMLATFGAGPAAHQLVQAVKRTLEDAPR